MDRRHRDGLLRRRRPRHPSPHRRTRWPAPSPSTTISTEATARRSTGCCAWSGRAGTGVSWPPASSTARGPGATAPPCGSPLGAWYADDPGAGDPPGGDLGLHHAPAPGSRGRRHGGGRRGGTGRLAGRAARPRGPHRRRRRPRTEERGRSGACAAPATCSTTTTRPPSRPSWAAGAVRRPMTPSPSPSGPAARALGDYETAFWTTAQVGGDVDTTCAIVGGVLAAGKGRGTARRVGAAHRGTAGLGAHGRLTASAGRGVVAHPESSWKLSVPIRNSA